MSAGTPETLALGPLARAVVDQARALGADEVLARVGRASEAQLQQRDGRLERCTEARTLGLSLSLLVQDRYSVHSTSDLRPEGLSRFLERAIAATRVLEPDPDRALLPRERMGSLDPAALALDDADSFAAHDPGWRRQRVSALEEAVRAQAPADAVSYTAHLWESRSESAVAASNGFEGWNRRTQFGWGAELTVREADGRLPEAYSFCSASRFAALPGVEPMVGDLLACMNQSRDAHPCASGRYPLLLDARVTGRILGALLGPLYGSALHEGRSLFQGRVGQALAPAGFTLLDDPTLPEGLGSRPFDSDGQPAQALPLFEGGVLRNYLLDVYYARRLGLEPTTGSTSNVVMPAGPRAWAAIAAEHPKVIRVTSFLGGNSNPASGDFSFGVRGQLLERGQPVANLSEMNVSGNLLDLLARFVEAADDPYPWSSMRVPTLLFDDVQFSGT